MAEEGEDTMNATTIQSLCQLLGDGNLRRGTGKLARQLGVSKQTVWRWRTGQTMTRSRRDLDALAALAKLHNIEVAVEEALP